MGLFSGPHRDHRLVIAGGGTGGHLFPGVAVVEAVERLDPSIDIGFVGSPRGIEARVVPELGYDFHAVDVPMLRGQGVGGWARGLATLPMSGWASLGVFERLNPGLVVSVGGYAAGPFTMLAALRGVPTALMEQNSTPGLTNRLLAKVVDRGFLTFEDARPHFPHLDCQVPGNPIRRGLVEMADSFDYQAPVEADSFNILIIGGSGGAASFNRALPADICALDELVSGERGSGERAATVAVRHQCGRGRRREVAGRYDGFAGPVDIVEFIDDMADAYDWADLVICRAGASTIAEILVLGLPALYVPFADAADDHQTKNAQSIARAGAGITIADADIGQGRVTRLLSGLIDNPISLDQLAEQASTLGRPDAADQVARACLSMMRRS